MYFCLIYIMIYRSFLLYMYFALSMVDWELVWWSFSSILFCYLCKIWISHWQCIIDIHDMTIWIIVCGRRSMTWAPTILAFSWSLSTSLWCHWSILARWSVFDGVRMRKSRTCVVWVVLINFHIALINSVAFWVSTNVNVRIIHGSQKLKMFIEIASNFTVNYLVILPWINLLCKLFTRSLS